MTFVCLNLVSRASCRLKKSGGTIYGPASTANLVVGKWIKPTIPKKRVPKVSANFRIVRKRSCLVHNEHVQLFFFFRLVNFNIWNYFHLYVHFERLPVRYANDFFVHSIPVLIKTSMKRAATVHVQKEKEVRKSIRLADCTEDDVNIVNNRKPWSITFDTSFEGKYVQA